MSRASVFVVLFGVLVLAACYYDKSDPELGKAGEPNYIDNLVAYELVSQPVKFKFGEPDDVVTDDVATDTTGQPCDGIDCTATGFVCHPTADVCVKCYVGEDDLDVNCEAGTEYCFEEPTDPTQNYCDLN